MNAEIHVARDSREERGAARVSFSTYSRQFGGQRAIRGGCCCGNLLATPSQHGRLHQGAMNDKKRELIVTD